MSSNFTSKTGNMKNVYCCSQCGNNKFEKIIRRAPGWSGGIIDEFLKCKKCKKVLYK